MALSRKTYNSLMQGFASHQKELAQQQSQEDVYKQFMSQGGDAAQNDNTPDGGQAGQHWWEKAADWAVGTAKGIASTGQRTFGTAEQVGIGLFGAADTGISLLKGDRKGAEKKNADYGKAVRDIADQKALDDGSMSFIGNDVARGDANPAQFGAQFGKAGSDVAAFVQPELKAVGALKGAAIDMGANAVTGAASTAADEYARTGQVNAGDVLQSAAENALVAGAIHGAKGVKNKVTGKGGADANAPAESGPTRVDLTDQDIPLQLRQRAMANGTGYVPEGKTIQEVPAEVKQLAATSEKPEDIQAQLEAMQQGNYDPSHYDTVTSDGQRFTAEDVASATQKQVDILQNRMNQLKAQAEGVDNNTGSVNVPEGVDPSTYTGDSAGRAKAQEAVDALQAQIDDLQKNGITPTGEPGVQKVLNADKVRATFTDLQDRLVNAKNQDAANRKFVEENSFTTSDRSPDQVAKELADAKNGKVPASAMVEQPDFQSAHDVAAAFPQLQEQATALTGERLDLVKQLDATLTPDKAEIAKQRIDAKYEGMRKSLEGMPKLRQQYELQKIDEAHMGELQQIDQELAATGDRASQLQQQLDSVNAQERDMVMRANFLKSNHPERFQVVDAKAHADHIVDLEKEKFVHDAFPSPDDANSVITNTMVRSDTPQHFQARMTHDDALKKAFDQKVESAMKMGVKTEKPGLNVLSSPIDVLRRWGERGKYMADQMVDAHMNFARDRGAFINTMHTWHDDLKGAGENASTNVFRALDGEDVKLNPAEQNIHDEIRAYLDTMAGKLGLTDQTKLSNYVPHMFEQSFGKNYNELEKLVAKIRYGVDEAGKKISNDEKAALAKQLGNVDAESLAFIRSNNAWKIKNGHLEQRTGAQGYSQDLFKVLSSYDNIANKKIHYEPAMRLVNALTTDLTSEQKNYITRFFSRVKGDHSSTFEHTLDRLVGEGNTAKLLSGQRRLSNASVMGASPLTWVKNMQDTTKVWADRPVKHVVTSIPDAIRAMRYGSEANRELFTNGIMESNQASFLKGMSDDFNTSKMGKFKTAAHKTEQLMWSGMRATDAFTRALNYHASIKEFMEKNPGGKMDDAIKYAQGTNRDTVFSFSDLDVPVGLNNSIGRSTLNMQTYNLQTAKYIMKTFGNVLEKTDDGYRFSPEGFWKMSKYVAANVAFMTTVGAALGLKPQDLVPFGNEIAGGQLPQSPLVAQLVGNDFQKGIIPTAGATISELFKAGTGKSNNLAGAAGDLGSALTSAAGGLVPLKTQATRTLGAIQANESGIAKSASGNYQFNQNDDAFSQAFSTVFGKNVTENGKKWTANGSQTLSPSEMRLGQSTASGVSIDKLPPEQQKQYVDFYNAVNAANPYDFSAKKDARTKALEEARVAAKDGNVNAVNRIISTFNTAAQQRLQPFVSEHGNTMAPAMGHTLNNLFIQNQDLVPQGWQPQQ